MKKSLFAAALAVLLGALCVFGLAACGEDKTHTLTAHAEKDATCTEAGNIAYWECGDCGKYFADAEGETEIADKSDVVIAAGHSLSAHAEKDATCTEVGNIAYWECTECGKYFADADGKSEIADKSDVVIAAGHSLSAHAAKDATCTEAGNIAYWECTECGKCFADAEGMSEVADKSSVIVAAHHTLTAHAAKDATCTEAGNIAYWECRECGKYFADAEGETEIADKSSVIVAAHHTLAAHTAQDATCTEAGNIAYWECTECGKYFADADGKSEIGDKSSVIVAAHHTLTAHAAKDATCTEAGNIAYWECEDCGKYFADAEGETEIADKSSVIVAAGHSLAAHTAQEATCAEAGNIAYWECTACGKYFADAEGKSEIADKSDVVIAAGHSLSAHTAQEATCAQAGNIAYWECGDCGKYFADAEGKSEIGDKSSVIVAAHHTLTAHEEKAATCTEAGNIAYWECTACGNYFADADGKSEIADKSSVIVAAGHILTAHAEKAATCTEEGNFAYWMCEACGKYFADAEGKSEVADKSSVIVAAHHTLTAHAEKAATCTEEGNIAYWECKACGKYFADADGEREIADKSSVIVPPHHTLAAREEVVATCTEAGNIAYWECTVCGKYFSDADGETEIADKSDVVIAAGHVSGGVWWSDASVHWQECIACNERLSEGVHEEENGVCKVCGYSEAGAPSLEYEQRGEGYVVTGIGSVKGTGIFVPQQYNGLPVIGIADQAFYGCRTLTRVQLPEGLQTIGDLAFKDCASLADVVFPSTLKSIGVSAFEDCVKLTSLLLPDGLEKIGQSAFEGCDALDSISVPFTGESPEAETMSHFGFIFGATQAAFNGQYVPASLKEVTVRCPIIAGSAFEGCGYIQTVILGDEVEELCSLSFYNCGSLKNFHVGKNLKRVGDYVFGGTNVGYMDNVWIEDLAAWCSIEFIDGYRANPICETKNLFIENEPVTELVIPEGVESIGNFAFMGCFPIESVLLPEGLRNIGDLTFAYCEALSSVTLPASLESIGGSAFEACSSLRDICFMGTRAQWEELVAASGLDLGDVSVHFLGA